MSSSENKRHGREEDGGQSKTRQAKKARETSADSLLLDRHGYPYHSERDGANPSTHANGGWTAYAVTSRGARFQLLIHAQEPPGVSRLLFKADMPADILASCDPRDTPYFLRGPRSAEFNLRVISSDEKVLLLQALCVGTDYFIMDRLDVSPPVLTRLPEMPPCVHSELGLMRRNDGYVVAALQQAAATEAWYVSFFSSSTNAWHRKAAYLAPDLGDWSYWEIVAVLVCGGRFWWLDLRRRLLSCSCDSLLQEDDGTEPRLEFTALPNVSMEQARDARLSDYPLLRDRCVVASGGSLRYVEMRVYRDLPIKSTSSPPPLCDDCRGGSVQSWTLNDSRLAWAEDHTLKLADVWRDDSYGTTGLPREAPEFPLVDRLDPNVVYFSIIKRGDGDSHVFGIDLRTKKVVKSCSRSCAGLNDVYYALQRVMCTD